MPVRSTALPANAALSQLADGFSRFKHASRSARPIYPPPLRQQAAIAVRLCGAFAPVAAACGVSTQSVRNWTKQLPPAARRLAVVNDTPNEPAQEQTPAVFAFRLAHGVSCEVTPAQALWLIRELGGRA